MLPNFYSLLEPFRDFAEITQDRHFRAVPDDWVVFITDVVGSTEAIEAGCYKDVNTLGAGTIAAVRNVLGNDAFPSIFGGDGATVIVPPALADEVAQALAGLRVLADQRFGLKLRAARIPVSTILSQGVRLEVARHELYPGKCVAVVRGGGLARAERMMKTQPELEVTGEAGRANLQGLSCRWNPVPSRRGKVLALIVQARGADEAGVYAQVLDAMEHILAGALEQANPIQASIMSYHTVRECLHDEKRYHNPIWSLPFVMRFAEIVAAVLIFRHKIPPLFFDARHYERSMGIHADFRKFDDCLRLVIDCTPEQAEAIDEVLKQLHDEGLLYYGIHHSDQALMTCLVETVRDGRHLHFVDGGSGGYAVAARHLKAQIAGAANAT